MRVKSLLKNVQNPKNKNENQTKSSLGIRATLCAISLIPGPNSPSTIEVPIETKAKL